MSSRVNTYNRGTEWLLYDLYPRDLFGLKPARNFRTNLASESFCNWTHSVTWAACEAEITAFNWGRLVSFSVTLEVEEHSDWCLKIFQVQIFLSNPSRHVLHQKDEGLDEQQGAAEWSWTREFCVSNLTISWGLERSWSQISRLCMHSCRKWSWSWKFDFIEFES